MPKILIIEVDDHGVMHLVSEMSDTDQAGHAEMQAASGIEPQATEAVESKPSPVAESGPVRLDPKDPNFEARKKELKALGYRYVGKYQQWYPPRESQPRASSETSQFDNWWGQSTVVGLQKDDPDFGPKKAALKKAGFKWNSTLSLWEKPAQQ